MQWYSKSQSGRKDFQDIYPYMSVYLYIIYIPHIHFYNNTKQTTHLKMCKILNTHITKEDVHNT